MHCTYANRLASGAHLIECAGHLRGRDTVLTVTPLPADFEPSLCGNSGQTASRLRNPALALMFECFEQA